MNAGSVYTAAGAPVWPILLGAILLVATIGFLIWLWKPFAARVYGGGVIVFIAWFIWEFKGVIWP